MQIRPIVSEQDYDAAVARISVLMPAEPGSVAGAELDALVTLVGAYEQKHFSVSRPTPIAAIKFQMEQRGLTRKDMEPMLGSRARVSEILNGKRDLTLAMIRRLHAQLGIPVEILVGAMLPVSAESRKVSPRVKSPQEKKMLSLEYDRRNTFGENAKASRKNIPKSKHRSQRAERRASATPLRALSGKFDEQAAIDAELQSRTEGIKKDRGRFKKRPDKPLGQVIQKKMSSGRNSFKAVGRYSA